MLESGFIQKNVYFNLKIVFHKDETKRFAQSIKTVFFIRVDVCCLIKIR